MIKRFIFLLSFIWILGCCKDEPPAYNPSADFIMYQPKTGWYQWYWEKVDRDTFGWGGINFEAKDTSEGIEYEWQIGSENIKGKRAVYRDFSNVPSNTTIPIELRVHQAGKRSDTLVRNLYITIDIKGHIRKKYNWLFFNDKNPQDSLRIRVYEYDRQTSSSGSDTLFINDCKKYLSGSSFLINLYEMGFSIGKYDNWSPCIYGGSLINTFIKLDNKNKNKAYLRTEHSENGKLVLYTYTGYTVQ